MRKGHKKMIQKRGRVNRIVAQGPTEMKVEPVSTVMCAPSATLASVGEDVAWGESCVTQGWGFASEDHDKGGSSKEPEGGCKRIIITRDHGI